MSLSFDPGSCPELFRLKIGPGTSGSGDRVACFWAPSAPVGGGVAGTATTFVCAASSDSVGLRVVGAPTGVEEAQGCVDLQPEDGVDDSTIGASGVEVCAALLSGAGLAASAGAFPNLSRSSSFALFAACRAAAISLFEPVFVLKNNGFSKSYW